MEKIQIETSSADASSQCDLGVDELMELQSLELALVGGGTGDVQF